MINQWFKLTEHNTTIKQEVLAGISTFLAMAYIIISGVSILVFMHFPSRRHIYPDIL